MTIELNDVAFAYKERSSIGKTVLNGLHLSVRPGECVGVIGQEGAGKTTLLQLMNGLLKPDRGTVCVDEIDVWRQPDSAVKLRRRIGFAFQFPEQQFFCQTVEDELLYAKVNFRDQSSFNRLTPYEALELVGLHPSQYLDRSPFSLSMGEARRVALATVAMMKPEALLLDEPTVGLDGNGIEFVVSLLRRMKGNGVTVVMVSHDVDVLAEVASRIIVLDGGKVCNDLPVQTIFTNETLLAEYGYRLPEIVSLVREFVKNDGRFEDRFYTLNEAMTVLRSN